MRATGYRVTVRGQVPANLAQKVAEAHARALAAQKVKPASPSEP